MKTNLLPTCIESGAPAFEPGTGRVLTVALTWLALGTGASANGCGFDPTCAETATCQPSAQDGGAEDSSGDRAGMFDQRNTADGIAPGDIRSDVEPDTSRPSDARSSDDTRVDSPLDGPTRDTIDATRADAFTDSSVDVKSADASDSSATDSGIVNVDAPLSDTSNDTAPGIDSSNDVSVDMGGTADVVVGCNATTCPSGCCYSNNQCVTTPSIDACGGWAGGKCQGCTAGQECNGTSCVCTANSCTSGCCDSTNHCVPFASQSDTQCGAGGACTSCSATMQKCDTSNGQCVCNAASCPTGCCDSTKQCVPYSRQSDAQCGGGGLACSACTSNKFCNASGGCDVKNWCRTQTIPAGVAVGDYQCVDFESGIPSAWTVTATNSGRSMVSTARASSLPNSLDTMAWPQGNGIPSVGSVSWNSVAATALTSVVAEVDLLRPLVSGDPGSWVGRDELLCVAIGNAKSCLYAAGATRGLMFQSGINPVYCGDLADADIPPETWVRATLQMSTSGVVTLSLNGVSKATCNVPIAAITAATITVGVVEVPETGPSYEMYYDNLVAYTLR